MILEQYIALALKKIPLVWPLQQLVAVNPLDDLIEQPIESAVSDISKLSNCVFTMPLEKYYLAWDRHEINKESISQAVQERFKAQVEKLDENEAHLIQRIFTEFMIAKHSQNQVISLYRQAMSNLEKSPNILLICRVKKETYDNLLSVSNEIFFNWIANFFNKNLEPDQSFFECWYKNHWQSDTVATPKPLEFIQEVLAGYPLNEAEYPVYIEQALWQVKGWAGFCKWQKHYPKNPWYNQNVDIAELLAVWLGTESNTLTEYKISLKHESFNCHQQTNTYINLAPYIETFAFNMLTNSVEIDGDRLKQFLKCFDFSLDNYCWLWQRAYELTYEQQVMHRLKLPLSETKDTVDATWVFCIDVRSEPVRRALESIGNYKTCGYAGFFGLFFNLCEDKTATVQCPALVSPELTIEAKKQAENLFEQSKRSFYQSIELAKKDIAAPFVLFEMLGFWYSALLVFKNYFNQFTHKAHKPAPLKIKDIHQYFDEAYMVDYAKGFIKALDLGTVTSEFVIVCGHTATTENNPFQAALDCGACGGNSGLPNAIIACHILNDPKIRSRLQLDGVKLADNTVFIPGLHNTTIDEISMSLDSINLSQAQKNQVEILLLDSQRAMKQVAKEKGQKLYGCKKGLLRASDWAQLVPEWGLVNNSCFIIGPRALTENGNFDARSFLHDYNHKVDPEGAILKDIMQGPLVVTFWINMQYYFSSVAPDVYGSGNKSIHNIVSDIGVIEGNTSDLKFGLPKQSVKFKNKMMHEPRRLLVVMYAKQSLVNKVLSNNPFLENLVKGNWINLKIIEPPQDCN